MDQDLCNNGNTAEIKTEIFIFWVILDIIRHMHAHPVDWFPWSSEAYEKAKKEEKPVLSPRLFGSVTGAMITIADK
jgi:hypothetical protein